ncbi:MAG: methionyl-tRNA formyltransferase [Bacteroidales bacterium]|nr:methionyl-tRNA formyltransferase [Bacteroidales bacterium]
MNIIFMGTPEFASYSLEQIIATNHHVKAVVTVPDKPAGRGLKPQMSEVKKVALHYNIPCLQPLKLTDQAFINELKSFHADLFVVVAFKKLPEAVWSIPPKKTINLHASLLPEYRGAAPINWVIINGETRTGVTVFFINNDIDTGQIISYKEINIPQKCHAGLLHDILMKEGAKLLIESIDKIEKNEITVIDQSSFIIDPAKLKTAPKITPSMCKLDWTKKAEDIIRWIYGLSPYPGAYIELQNENTNQKIKVKIIDAELIDGKHESPAKTIITDNKTYWYIAADGGLIQVEECQAEGKKVMKIKGFLNGFRNLQQWKII